MAVWMSTGVLAQKTLTWDAAKRQLEASNPSLRAARIGIQESRADGHAMPFGPRIAGGRVQGLANEGRCGGRATQERRTGVVRKAEQDRLSHGR